MVSGRNAAASSSTRRSTVSTRSRQHARHRRRARRPAPRSARAVRPARARRASWLRDVDNLAQVVDVVADDRRPQISAFETPSCARRGSASPQRSSPSRVSTVRLRTSRLPVICRDGAAVGRARHDRWLSSAGEARSSELPGSRKRPPVVRRAQSGRPGRSRPHSGRDARNHAVATVSRGRRSLLLGPCGRVEDDCCSSWRSDSG